MTEATPLPLRLRLLIGGGSLLVGFLLAEGMARLADDNALPHLALFTQQADGQVLLQAGATQRLRLLDGHIYTVAIDDHALRVGALARSGWLAVGDSQVLGLGVEGEQAFAAVAGMANAGVPSHGVADAVTRARQLAKDGDLQGVVVVVNQANDWEEGLSPVAARYDVIGGRLLRSASTGRLGRAFWASPLPHSHLLYLCAMLATALTQAPAPAPAWMLAPEELRPVSRSLAGAIDALARDLAPLPVIAAYLPVDVAAAKARVPLSPFGKYTGPTVQPWTAHPLRDQLQEHLHVARFIDLLPALADQPDAFLDRDYHLSASGHARVAAQLSVAMEAAGGAP